MPGCKFQWKSATHKSDITKCSRRSETIEHPLKVLVVDYIPTRRILDSESSTGRSTPLCTPIAMFDLNAVLEGIDPLTKFTIEEVDPLSRIAAEMKINETITTSSNSGFSVEPWSSRKTAILAKFTTSEKLSIVSSFLADGNKLVVKAQSTPANKIQHRLEQLDYFEEGSQKKLDLSQGEYVGRIEQLNKELVLAWNTEQRVKALKIAIQCAKLLSDTDVLCFYPSKFVLITDTLDIFGSLVYDRLLTKADSNKQGSKMPSAMSENISSKTTPETVKETCRNWFYKIASIRELVPRIYVEMAIIKSYSFLSTSEYSDALSRLTRMISGIGNPLVAIYARCYLCRVGISITEQNISSNYLLQNFHDFLRSYNHLFSNTVHQDLTKQNMSIPAYFILYTPALDFILQIVASNSSKELLEELLQCCQKYGNSPLLLHSIMSAFHPSLISNRTTYLLGMIEDIKNFPSHLLLHTLGLCVSVSSPPIEHRSVVLNKVWKQISGLSELEDYICCTEVWIKYTVQNFSSHEVNAVIGDIITHVTKEKSYENCYNQLKNIVQTIMSHMQDFETLLSMDNFLPLVDLFQNEILKVEICKSILHFCITGSPTGDPVITNALLFLCTILHDSVNVFTPEDETRQISECLCAVIRKVNYGNDFEKQLRFYVEARGAFSSLDMVLGQLVQCVNTLAASTRQIVAGHHTRKTEAFVRACAAYCFITIPSITLIFYRLDLYLLSGRVALFNNCLEQADACFSAALETILELSQLEDKANYNENFLNSYIKNFLSLIIIVPDNPNNRVLDLMRTILNCIKTFSWNSQTCSLPYLYFNALDALSVMAQETYPYHISKVESNDTLYGSDPKFLKEIDAISSVIVDEILSYIAQVRSGRKQSCLALDLIVRILMRGDLSSQSMVSLCSYLWQLIIKDKTLDKRFINNTLEYFFRGKFADRNKILHDIFTINVELD